MQPKAQVSMAYFVQDELRNDILSRNEIVNSIETECQGDELLFPPRWNRHVTFYFLSRRFTSRSGKLSFVMSVRIFASPSQATTTVVHLQSNTQSNGREVLPQTSTWYVTRASRRIFEASFFFLGSF